MKAFLYTINFGAFGTAFPWVKNQCEGMWPPQAGKSHLHLLFLCDCGLERDDRKTVVTEKVTDLVVLETVTH